MVRREEIAVDGRPAYVWQGGDGDALLLLHGGWGGAEMHWAPVWDALARECQTLAPEVPGIAYESAWVPRSLDAAAAWVEKVLDATGTPQAWIVGNSFGGGLAARVASRSPGRCRGLVLVDGGPPPSMPAIFRRLARRRRVRRAIESGLRRSAWSPSTPDRAFADPRRAPAGLAELFAQSRPRQLRILCDLLIAGDPPIARPQARTLVVWGAQDRLPGGTPKTARRLAASLNAQLVLIEDAGHLPQVEQPEQFARAVLDFVRGAA